jgi:hypothetical protein
MAVGLGVTVSVRPVQLMFRDAYRSGVVHGFRAAALIATLIAEDLVSEHDHMIIAGAEIRIPAAVCQQSPASDSASTSETSSSASNSRNVQTGAGSQTLTLTRPAG